MQSGKTVPNMLKNAFLHMGTGRALGVVLKYRKAGLILEIFMFSVPMLYQDDHIQVTTFHFLIRKLLCIISFKMRKTLTNSCLSVSDRQSSRLLGRGHDKLVHTK